MYRSVVVIFLILPFISFSQSQYPRTFDAKVDSLLDVTYNSKSSAATRLKALKSIDSFILTVKDQYPLYSGIVKMYQAYGADVKQKIQYQNEAITLIRSNAKFLADSFSFQSQQLLKNYVRGNRLQEWLPIDTILRTVTSPAAPLDKYAILNYAIAKLNNGYYDIAQDLALYDLSFRNTLAEATTESHMMKLFDEWIAIKSRYEKWKATPYYKRDENLSFKNDFKYIISLLTSQKIKRAAVLENEIVKVNGSTDLRVSYYEVYKQAVSAFAEWTVQAHREGSAIIPLKDFIFYDLIPNELVPAAEQNRKPVANGTDFINLVAWLGKLYINTGNGRAATDIANRAIDFIKNYKQFSSDEVSRGLSVFLHYRVMASRETGKYNMALRENNILKTWHSKPKVADKEHMQLWNWFIEMKLQDVYTLTAEGKDSTASDSLSVLLDQLAPLANDSVELLYNSYQWPHLQYLSSQQMAQVGKWDEARSWLLDGLTTLEQVNHWENVSYYFPMQWLYFISQYRSNQKILQHIIANLVYYTGCQLQYTFYALAPETRMRFYQQHLSKYFDLYHQMLFNKELDAWPALKEKVIAQSLYLKNALSDGNLLPTNLLANGNDTASVQRIESIRASRNRYSMILGRLRMISNDNYFKDEENIQRTWFTLLEAAELDTIDPFVSWKKIAASLDLNQSYVETIRYTNWLTDSSATYGAYVISNGKLELVKLPGEEALISILKDPSASPQNSALDANNTRGMSIKAKPATQKKFRQGDEDKLGRQLLSPLWAHLENKKEVIFVADGILNRISIAALQWQTKYVFNYFTLRQLAGSQSLFQNNETFPKQAKALLAGGLNYGTTPDMNNIDRLFNNEYSWGYLPATQTEVQKLEPLFRSNMKQVEVLQGNAFPDTLKILPEYNFIHLATHGFYADSSLARKMYSKYNNKEAVAQEPMYRCGIALSNANNPPKTNFSDGYLLGFELAATDLRNCYLIALSACETGLGDLRNNLGVDGLSRALKLGGAKNLLISLWKVPDEPTALFMNKFYEELFKKKSPSTALQATQKFMSAKYPAPDWAAFVLIE